jgi:hypothetical protein
LSSEEEGSMPTHNGLCTVMACFRRVAKVDMVVALPGRCVIVANDGGE